MTISGAAISLPKPSQSLLLLLVCEILFLLFADRYIQQHPSSLSETYTSFEEHLSIHQYHQYLARLNASRRNGSNLNIPICSDRYEEIEVKNSASLLFTYINSLETSAAVGTLIRMEQLLVLTRNRSICDSRLNCLLVSNECVARISWTREEYSHHALVECSFAQIATYALERDFSRVSYVSPFLSTDFVNLISFEELSADVAVTALSSDSPHVMVTLDSRAALSLNLPPLVFEELSAGQARAVWHQALFSEFILSEKYSTVAVFVQGFPVREAPPRRLSHRDWKLSKRIRSYNRRISQSHTLPARFRMGKMEFMDYYARITPTLVKTCANRAPQGSLRDTHVKLFRHATVNNEIVMVPAQPSQEVMLLNWLCWANRVQFTNFVLVVPTRSAFDQLIEDKRVPAANLVLWESSASPSSMNMTDEANLDAVQLFRTEFIREALRLGLSVATFPASSVLFAHPFEFLSQLRLFHSADVQWAETDIFPHSSSKILFVRESGLSIRFWDHVARCQYENIRALQNPETESASDFSLAQYSERTCVDQTLRVFKATTELSTFSWPKQWFPDADLYFRKAFPQRNGYFPVLVYNDFENRTLQLSHHAAWSLLVYDPEDGCVFPDIADVDHDYAFSIPEAFRYHIRVLTYNRPQSLHRLLRSLNGSSYSGQTVTLTISIDHCESEHLARETVQIAEDFVWDYGKKHIVVHSERVGVSGQWLGCWEGIPNEDRDVLAVFEDDVEASPHWFEFLSAATEKYYREQQDHRLIGLGLGLQAQIVGESRKTRFGRKTHEALETQQHSDLYLYQLSGSWSTALFPRAWKDFLEWRESRPDGFRPCVPTLYSNYWWTAEPEIEWSQWMNRFAYEHGMFFLYTNFAGQRAFTTNYKEPGGRFQGRGTRTNDLVLDFRVEEFAFPDLRSLPLFDFHFNSISYSGNTLTFRRFSHEFPETHSPEGMPWNVTACWTMKDYIKYTL